MSPAIRRMLIATAALLAVVGVVTAMGPGKKVARVQGTVLIGGELVERGSITFHPAGGGSPAVGQIREDGTFSLRVGQGNIESPDESLIPAGEYTVTVVINGPSPGLSEAGLPVAGPRLMAQKYGSRKTSGLTRTIVAGENVLAFDLDPAAPDPEEPSKAGEAADDEQSTDQAVIGADAGGGKEIKE